jgi:hypothetical protein
MKRFGPPHLVITQLVISIVHAPEWVYQSSKLLMPNEYAPVLRSLLKNGQVIDELGIARAERSLPGSSVRGLGHRDQIDASGVPFI